MELPEALFEGTIDRGTILLAQIFEEIDHEKFFVIVGISGDKVAGFFFINSNIHPSVWKKSEQLAMQYPMKKSDYPFLKYDSFLCATNIITRDKSELASLLRDGDIEIKGDMKKEHMDEVLEMARSSKLFSKAEKREFFYP